jgi:hypothetical protein
VFRPDGSRHQIVDEVVGASHIDGDLTDGAKSYCPETAKIPEGTIPATSDDWRQSKNFII